MKEAIRERARELGFDDCRFTTAHAPETAIHFQKWLNRGFQGEMAYLERNAHKRVDPQQVLAGARSVITLAVSYHQPESAADKAIYKSHSSSRSYRSHPPPNPAGIIARYAQYSDYHDIIGTRLKQLTRFIDDLGGPGTRSLWYTDTGPLLERDLAQRAGLGFIGKHTNLISRQLGNWFFLSEIITTFELEPDPPETNHCGKCTRCLTACPTGALPAPFQLDARLCISYLTIELKGSIPLELRSLIGNRIFGCDDCLAACPWNRFARAGAMMKPHTRADLATPDLIELLSLDEQEFGRRFAGTPLLRLKRRGLLRNVCVALGNTGDASTLPALRAAAADPEPLIAEHARWAIQKISSLSNDPVVQSGSPINNDQK
ncbi:MAG TPA: tRNA epoxyqueuosine(34) reductase QueG [Candidatus Limnocylindrales bacterium]|jgi:epoxyqueuosine reductase|nr:tRNA epoxyqueuosine(34) reductase QueG [Candidatus Limnocylindrales bacterium]